MKDQLSNIEQEKNTISKHIQELNNSIGQTNIVTSAFVKESSQNEVKVEKKSNYKNKMKLNEEIKKIFSK